MGTGDITPGELDRLRRENQELRERYARATGYIRSKVNQLLTVMGTSPLRAEELDDSTLIETDPIGIVANSFTQILKHLHRTNDRLRFTSEELRAVFDSAGMGILVIDGSMKVLSYNQKLRQLFFPDCIDDITGRPCHEAICNMDLNSMECPFMEVFLTGNSVHQDHWQLKGGHFDVVGTPVRDASGRTTSLVLVYMDITERVLAERELRLSEERYRDLFENANDLIQSVGPDGTVLYVNRAWKETLGYSEAEVAKLSIFDVIHPECDECGPDFRSVVYGERGGRVETAFLTRDRRKILVEGNISSIYEDGTFVGTRGIFRDITSRKRDEAALSAERERLAITLRSIGDGVITTDTVGSVVLMNKVAEALTGWSQEQAAGRHVMEVFRLIHEKTRTSIPNPLEPVLRTAEKAELAKHTLLVARDGTERLIADSIAPIRDRQSNTIGAVVVFRDITERQRMEERILKSEKIESLGVLAGGIAHDFNNLLNSILGNIDMVMSDLPEGGRDQEALRRAERASLRARDLTSQLLTFSKGGAPIKRAASIAELIRESSDFTLRGSNVRAEFDLPADLWKAEFDEGQLSQVVNNIVLNAIQAMPGGGHIYIKAENSELMPGNPNACKCLKVTLRDTGPGIPPENMGRLFEPYFTTKAMGNGLGLATAYSIIKSHEGALEVESPPDGGAAFTFFLPAFLGTEQAAAAKPSDRASASLQRGKGKVLVMDDDQLVRMTACAMLERLGYEATESEDGSSALAAYGKALKEDKPFDAVIMDLTIPGGMGGAEVIVKLKELDPKARGIVSSGYSSDPIMANYRHYGFSGVLVKPYKKDEMDRVLTEVLAGG